jgi:RHS repeat-associated protein
VPNRYAYVYDPAGNRTAEQLDDAVTGASYNNRNQLMSRQAGGALLFRGSLNEQATVMVQGKPAQVAVDNSFVGSAQASSGTSSVVVTATDPSSNTRTNTYQVTESGATSTYTYDFNGNLTSDGTKTYEWNAENRLTAVKQGGSPLASFTYDGSGRRASKTVGGVTASYIYDGAQFLEERPSAGTPKRYVYGLGIDRPLAQAVGGATSYFVADHLGSITQVTDNSGAPTLTREYDPWGNLLQGSTTGGYAFTGREWDPETGLYYYRARYYDPAVVRFVSQDPVGLVGGSNLYRYALNNAIRHSDPGGLAPGDPYKSDDEAAIAALQDINCQSRTEDMEYSGRIYRCEDKVHFSYTAPKKNGRHGGWLRPSDLPWPKGTDNAGHYHTHGAESGPNYGDETFSGRDKGFDPFVPAYLATPSCRILKYSLLAALEPGGDGISEIGHTTCK